MYTHILSHTEETSYLYIKDIRNQNQ